MPIIHGVAGSARGVQRFGTSFTSFAGSRRPDGLDDGREGNSATSGSPAGKRRRAKSSYRKRHNDPIPIEPDADNNEDEDNEGREEEDEIDSEEDYNNDDDEEEHSGDEADWASRPLRRVRDWKGSASGSGRRKMEGHGGGGGGKPPTSTGRSKDQHSVLAALLPGSEIRDPSHRILVNTGTSRETVKFNIGGTMFETHRSTLHKLPHSPLADDTFLDKYYRRDSGHYFFDRDPEVFSAILNYLRTGELHLPTKFCGPAVKMEMEFWGIEEDEIEECCWTNYSAWTTTLEALRKLEKDRKVHMPGSAEHFLLSGNPSPNKRFRRIQMIGWEILNNPQSGIAAQIYSYTSLAFVVISIFSFIAQTHDYFRINVDDITTTTAATTTTNNNNNNNNNNSNALLLTLNNASAHNNATGTGSDVSNATMWKPPSGGGGDEERMLDDDVHPIMLYIDAVCLTYFLVEFFFRFALSPRKCKLLLLPMTVFELLALLPDLIEFGVRLFHPELRTVEAVDVITFLRLLRVFRIFRLMRHFPGLWILFYTLKASVKELLLLLMFLCVGMLFFASLIYYTDDRKIFTSIPMACWWSIITMTTVGYGDMYPTTKWGYVVGSATAICGVLVIGFTVPVLVNNFILYYQHTQCALTRDGAKARRDELKKSMKNSSKGEHLEMKPGVRTLSAGVVSSNAHVEKMQRLRKLHAEGFPDESGVNPVDSVEGGERKKERNGNAHQSPCDTDKKPPAQLSQESENVVNN